MIAALNGLVVGCFAVLANQSINGSVGWAIAIFALGIVVGWVGVFVADLRVRRAEQRQRSKEGGDGAR